MERLARLVVRLPWLVVGLWVLGIGAVVLATPKGPAPKTPPPHPLAAQRASDLLDRSFPAGQNTGNHPPTSILMLAPDRVLPSDLQALQSLRPQLLAWDTASMGWGGPDRQVVARIDGPRISKDGQAALVNLTYTFSGYCYPDCTSVLERGLRQIRPRLHPGVTLALTGQGLVYQAQDAALNGLTNSGFSPTLIACIVLLLLILGFVYRAPLAVLVPLLCIGAAVYTSLDLVKILAVHTRLVPHGDITNEFVSVVLFGAGTNYCLFLLSRYRESLRAGIAFREAIVLALTRVGEAISSSAATVIAAMALMGFTSSPLFRAVGPAVAVSVAVMLAAGLTLVPALMRLCGRALFWPTRPGYAHHGDAETRIRNPMLRRPEGEHGEGDGVRARVPVGAGRGFWHGVGRQLARRPRVTLLACLALLLPLAAYATALSPSYDDLRTLPSSNPAVRAAEAVQTHFGSATEPETLVIADPGGGLRTPAGARIIADARAAVGRDPAVRAVGAPTLAPGGQVAAVPLTLAVETSSPAAHAAIGRLQTALAGVVRSASRPGLEALLSGDSAYTHDEAVQVTGDFYFIVGWVTLIIFLILCLLVRSFSAPIYLLLSVALSAGSSIGLTVLLFHIILGQQVYYTTPVFAFVFLVALGEDFNILLMARIREEVRQLGLRAGVARAVGTTGGTLSSCGLIMAGTFAALMQFQVTFLQQIGFAVAAGVLLDTFVIRPLLVPSVVCLLGRWNWVTVRGVSQLPLAVTGGEDLQVVRAG